MEINLTQGRIAIIDGEDANLVMGHKWFVSCSARGLAYAYRTVNKKTVYMHRLIINAQKGEIVDHINGDGLDNRRENLRIIPQSVNIANAKRYTHAVSGFRGVEKFRKGWKARYKHMQKAVSSKEIASATDAAILRDAIVRLLVSETVTLNFPEVHMEWAINEAKRLIHKRLGLEV